MIPLGRKPKGKKRKRQKKKTQADEETVVLSGAPFWDNDDTDNGQSAQLARFAEYGLLWAWGLEMDVSKRAITDNSRR